MRTANCARRGQLREKSNRSISLYLHYLAVALFGFLENRAIAIPSRHCSCHIRTNRDWAEKNFQGTHNVSRAETNWQSFLLLLCLVFFLLENQIMHAKPYNILFVWNNIYGKCTNTERKKYLHMKFREHSQTRTDKSRCWTTLFGTNSSYVPAKRTPTCTNWHQQSTIIKADGLEFRRHSLRSCLPSQRWRFDHHAW